MRAPPSCWSSARGAWTYILEVRPTSAQHEMDGPFAEAPADDSPFEFEEDDQLSDDFDPGQ